MPYILNATTLRAPNRIEETNSTQVAQIRTLQGTIGRDYFGSNKRIWKLDYKNVNATDYATIKAIYDSYLSTASAKSWSITEANYAVSATTVHVDLQQRSFSIKGSDYLSDFTLILTEA